MSAGDIFRLSISNNGAAELQFNLWILLLAGGAIVVLSVAFRWLRNVVFRQNFEIDEIQLGVGPGKVKIRPNHDDLQMAYRLWIELRTRKLGLPFDEAHDVIAEIYDSWYEFFRITRELIKTIPVKRVRADEDTQLLVGLSIDVLNKAVRPHLTKWQARYRHWLGRELQRTENQDVSPQEIQRRFPEYKELVEDLKRTNAQLVSYAKVLARIVELGPKATREVGGQ